MKPGLLKRSASSSPVQNEHTHETDHFSIYDSVLQTSKDSITEAGNFSSTTVEYDRQMKMLEDTQEVAPEESLGRVVSSVETPRFNADKSIIRRARADHITFGSMASSPMSEAEHSRKMREFEVPHISKIDEMSREDTTNKREYIISLAKRRTRNQLSENSIEKSPNVSISNMESLEIETQSPSLYYPKETLPEASRHFSFIQTNPKPKNTGLTLETMREAKSTGCCGNCLMLIFN